VELVHKQKKNKVLNYLKNTQADICLIQETHLSQYTQNSLKPHILTTVFPPTITQNKEEYAS